MPTCRAIGRKEKYMIFTEGFRKTSGGFECRGKIYTSFMEMVKEVQGDKFCAFETEVSSTESYHYSAGLPFVYTDGISELAEKHNCVWLLSVIHSYFGLSKTYAKVDDRGNITWLENKNGKDEFLVCFLQKTSENSAVFTIDLDDGDDCKTVVYQKIPFTEIDIDSLKIYIENGVVLLPNER